MCQLCGFGGMKVPSVLANAFARFPKVSGFPVLSGFEGLWPCHS